MHIWDLDGNMLTIDYLSVNYGSVIALDGVRMKFPLGSITAILGSNGAGKTSLLNAIVGLVEVKGGEVRLGDRAITGLDTAEIARLGVALVPEGRRIFPRMSVRDNLLTGAHLKTDKRRTLSNLDKVNSYFPILEKRSSQAAGSLSGGEQQMLAIGRALMSDPRLLLLDEPSTGLAPKVEQDVMGTLVKLATEDNIGIVLVEQNATLALGHSTNAYVLESGRVSIEGRASDLVGDRRVQEAYLGV
jgi:branched-chain amino acid transport system ATP-binding protein